MDVNNIDFDALKKRGFLRSRDDKFTLRTRMPAGNYNSEHLRAIADIADKYGKGMSHLTVRQGIEVPYIEYADIDKIESELTASGVKAGTSGPRLRATTCCPGNNWCKRGLIDTFRLFDRIENEKNIKCATDLPHKFKIVISGCPNACTRAQASEIGIHGNIEVSGGERKTGYTVYLGGCGGRSPRQALKLDKTYSEDEVLSLIERVVEYYKNNAKPRQRLALLMEEKGKDVFLSEAGIFPVK